MAKLDSKPWIKTTIGSFIATVLGIVLTLGTSKLAEIKNNRAMQRQCVFNVLSDIDNASTFFRKDSTLVAELGQWLPDYMERHAFNQELPLDSIVVKFHDTQYYPLYVKNKYIPVGRAIMSSVVPANEDDMALHRTMELAYAYIDRVQATSDLLLERLEYMRQIGIKMNYSTEEYSFQDAADLYMNDDEIKLLSEMVSILDGSQVYGSFLRNLQTYYDTILKMTGITKADLEAYYENVNKRQGR